MTLLVVGSTGTLGQAVLRAARRRAIAAIGAARHGTAPAIDIRDGASIRAALDAVGPRIVVNAAALADVEACERDPGAAYAVNGRGAALLAAGARRIGARFVHVSTDHFFSGDGAALHDEQAPVTLVNEYARTKFAAEALVLAAGPALVVRTNLTGWRGWPRRPTFVEWAVDALQGRRPVTAFVDFVTSTIDADALGETILDLVDRRVEGILNVAAREAVTKAAFIRRLAAAWGIADAPIAEASVTTLAVRRADSLGLDVGRAERLLGRRLPGCDEVIANLRRTAPMAACAS